eukprot:scaffold12181_cov58-Phaeocystis_antarctica.AAC.1
MLITHPRRRLELHAQQQQHVCIPAVPFPIYTTPPGDSTLRAPMRWASSVDPADVLGICKLQIYLSMSRQLYK